MSRLAHRQQQIVLAFVTLRSRLRGADETFIDTTE
jgi:hypothetical protein